jgi:predicted membrane metal-binding protein
MLWTIIGVLLLAWLLGLLFDFTGGLIHILLVIAVIILVVKLIRRA